MNLFRLTLKFLIHKPLVTLVSILLIIIPVAIITFIIIFDIQAKSYLNRNVATIDLILGPKGDAEQLTTSSLLNYGPFTGSISLKETRELVRNRVVKLAIPIYSVDNFEGFRITGTNLNYTDLYRAALVQGNWWDKDMDAVLGYHVAKKLKLHVGDTFFSSHGLGQGGIIHGDKPFRVVGIMRNSRNSLNNIILCSIQSVWLLHIDEMSIEGNNVKGPAVKGPDDYFPFDFPEGEGKVLSAVLIQLRSPVSAASFISRDYIGNNFQAVSPLAELSKMYRSVQFTLAAIGWLGFSFSGIALLTLFVRLYYFVEEKSKDIFLLRSLGATCKMTAALVLLQGLIVADIAVFSGIVISHVALGIASTFPELKFLFGTTGARLYWQEITIYLVVLCSGVLVSLFPAWKACRINVQNNPMEEGLN